MDIFLKVWAVAGPLLAAAASAVWARRLQREDRTHADQRAQLARNHALEDEQRVYLRSVQTDNCKELKATASAFIAALHEYVISAGVATTPNAPHEASVEFSDARKSIDTTYGKIVILGDEELSACATEMINAATALPASASGGKFAENETQRFLAAKAAFITCARTAVRCVGSV